MSISLRTTEPKRFEQRQLWQHVTKQLTFFFSLPYLIWTICLLAEYRRWWQNVPRWLIRWTFLQTVASIPSTKQKNKVLTFYHVPLLAPLVFHFQFLLPSLQSCKLKIFLDQIHRKRKWRTADSLTSIQNFVKLVSFRFYKHFSNLKLSKFYLRFVRSL